MIVSANAVSAVGLFVMGQGLVKTASGIIACRFFMGMCEAGFVPGWCRIHFDCVGGRSLMPTQLGCAYLIGSYYKRDEFLRRYAIFFSANMAAGAFNGVSNSL